MWARYRGQWERRQHAARFPRIAFVPLGVRVLVRLGPLGPAVLCTGVDGGCCSFWGQTTVLLRRFASQLVVIARVYMLV